MGLLLQLYEESRKEAQGQQNSFSTLSAIIQFRATVFDMLKQEQVKLEVSTRWGQALVGKHVGPIGALQLLGRHKKNFK